MTRRIDYHIHTKLCRHAIGEMEDYIQVAISKKLDEMGFADHIPMTYLPSESILQDYCMKLDELPLYVQSVRDLQEKYLNIVIKLGIEADYYQGKEEEINKLLSRFDFDYVYGSIHIVNDLAIDDDRVRYKLEKYDFDEIFRDYYRTLKKAIQSGLFDIMTHLDLPKKYGDRPTHPIDDLIEEVIDALAKHKVCVELNTSGLRRPVKEQYPSMKILQACQANDIPITLGSDSHKPEEVGWELNWALNTLREIGYSQIVGFENRKKIYFEI